MSAHPIRAVVVEDSAVTREYLVHLLEQDPALRVVGTARNGREALDQVERLAPDVVLMDIHMPEVDGYEGTRLIMERRPTPIVLASASLRRDETAMTFEAIRAGALAAVDKPTGPGHPMQEETARRLLETVRLMSEVKVVRRRPRAGSEAEHSAARAEAPAPPLRPPSDRQIRLVAIGASTGGPPVLGDLLGALPRDLPVPVLVVQHIAPGFVAGLAEWLGRLVPLPVKLGEDGEAVRPGTVYLAPDGVQMAIGRDGRLGLEPDSPANGFCPSVNRLFESVALVYGRSALGILLTGMGRDGAMGLRQIREAGGTTVAQDRESSVVFGMPGEALALGAVEYVLPPERIAGFIRSLVRAA